MTACTNAKRRVDRDYYSNYRGYIASPSEVHGESLVSHKGIHHSYNIVQRERAAAVEQATCIPLH